MACDCVSWEGFIYVWKPQYFHHIPEPVLQIQLVVIKGEFPVYGVIRNNAEQSSRRLYMSARVEGGNPPPPSSAMWSPKAMAAHGSRQKICTLLNMYTMAMRRGRAASEPNVSLLPLLAYSILSQQGQRHDSTPRRRIAWMQSLTSL